MSFTVFKSRFWVNMWGCKQSQFSQNIGSQTLEATSLMAVFTDYEQRVFQSKSAGFKNMHSFHHSRCNTISGPHKIYRSCLMIVVVWLTFFQIVSYHKLGQMITCQLKQIGHIWYSPWPHCQMFSCSTDVHDLDDCGTGDMCSLFIVGWWTGQQVEMAINSCKELAGPLNILQQNKLATLASHMILMLSLLSFNKTGLYFKMKKIQTFFCWLFPQSDDWNAKSNWSDITSPLL